MNIYWQHLTQQRFLRYVYIPLIYILTIFILLFLTTPTAMLNAVTMGGGIDTVLGFKDRVANTKLTKYIVGSLLPSLIILAINGILMLTLKLLSKTEYHSRFSNLQKSEMIKLFFYWLLNMLIIPGIASLALNNLYSVLMEGYNNFDNLVSSLFNLRNGNFFLVLLIYSAAFGFLKRIVYIKMLFINQLSSTQAVLKKQQQLNYEEWLKEQSWLFNFGSSYALMLVIIAIGLVFQ